MSDEAPSRAAKVRLELTLTRYSCGMDLPPDEIEWLKQLIKLYPKWEMATDLFELVAEMEASR